MEVVNLKGHKNDYDSSIHHYIGRNMNMGGWNLKESVFHNPWKTNSVMTREEVVENYLNYACYNPEIFTNLRVLFGKKLACWCHPEQCHGHILLALLKVRFSRINNILVEKIRPFEINIINENILKSKEEYIIHQANCVSKSSAGLAKELFNKWPEYNIYKKRYNRPPSPADQPGTIKITGSLIHLFGQYNPGKPTLEETEKTRFKWFQAGFEEIKKINPRSLALPYKISCGLAGGFWPDYIVFIQKWAFANKIQIFMYKI